MIAGRYKVQVTSYRSKLITGSYKIEVASCKLQVTSCKLQVTSYKCEGRLFYTIHSHEARLSEVEPRSGPRSEVGPRIQNVTSCV